MGRRVLGSVLLSGLLAAVSIVALCPAPEWMAQRIAFAAPSAVNTSSPAPDETAVYQTVSHAVAELQAALHRKVASTLVHKVEGKTSGTSYESTWQVTVRYWLDYAKPDEVPYLKGMQKCLTEFGGTSDKEWLAWAQGQVDRMRSEYAEEIAFQQKAELDVLVTGTVDEAGNPIPSSLKVFHVTGSEPLSISAETLAAPSDRMMEQAGYYYLKDRLDAQSASSGSMQGGTSTPEQGATPGTSPSSTSPSSPAGIRGSVSTNTRILFAGIAVLSLLAVILALNQYLVGKSKR